MEILNFTAPTAGNLVKVIYWLVSICSSVALGVILFTFLLKLITLPFDYFSRVSMRKNSVKMEEMRPELEKLQKQYADNKDLYNQKMMALYKKNGYSMFGSCLPTILTLVIFIVAINGFTNYSKFQNQTYFYNMTNSYNNVIYSGLDLDAEGKYIYRDSNGKIIVNYENIFDSDKDQDGQGEIALKDKDGKDFSIYFSAVKNLEKIEEGREYYIFTLETTNGYVFFNNDYYIKQTDPQVKHWQKETYSINEQNIKSSNPLANEQNNELKISFENKKYEYSDFIADANLVAKFEEKNKNEYSYSQTEHFKPEHFLNDIQKEKSAETYRKEQQSFFWVKNIWATDSTTSHPIESNWSKFKNTHGYEGADIGADGYNNLIAKLEFEKTAPNGYFILIILTAASSFVMQIVLGKAQKAQMELQTVNGQGVQTQKMMQWMMPMMMAFFAFMYTAAFSIYIVVNSIISIGTTFLINYIADVQLKREKKKNQTSDGQKIRGRIFVPKEEPKKDKKEQKQKVKKDDKFAHESGGDFLTGKVKKRKNK